MPSLRHTLPLLAVLAAAPQLARAHAVLVASNPNPHQSLDGETLPVKLRFNSRVDGPHCTIALLREGGIPVQLALDNQPAPDTIQTTAEHLEPGAYTLQWQALAADGHITRGEIPFTVDATSNRKPK